MSDLSLNNSSPFDSIRRVDENNQEFWYARELMNLLGYKTWQKFNSTIKRAYSSCQNSQDDVGKHFLPGSVKSKGRTADDWQLSRFACYLVAMNGDPSKIEIAQAQSYFAIKAREAEVILPQQNERLAIAQLEIEKLKLENENLKLKTNYMERRDSIRLIHGASMLALLDGRPDAVIEKVEKVTETIVIKGNRSVNFEGKSTKQVATELGFKTGKDLERWLEKIGHDDLICQGLRVNQTPYIPTENLQKVKRIFTQNKNRQLLIGE
jgi:hypothetical protein